MRWKLVPAFAMLVALGIQADAWGQRSQPSQTSGLFGGRSLGSSIGGDSRGGGIQPGGGSGAGGGAAGQMQGNERFVRGNRQAGDFVGADSRDVQGVLSGLNAGGQSGLGGQGGRNRGLGAQGGRQRQSQNNRGGFEGDNRGGGKTRHAIRTTRSVAFNYPLSTPSRMGNALSARLQKALTVRVLPGMQVTMEGRTAVLRGVAATDHDREIAGQLALLEPGVSQVQNEMTVAEPQSPDLQTP